MPGSSASETCAQECIEVAVLERSPTLAYLLTKRLIRGLGRSDPKQAHSIEPRCEGAGFRETKSATGRLLGCPQTIADEAEKPSALRLGSVPLSLLVFGFRRTQDADLFYRTSCCSSRALTCW